MKILVFDVPAESGGALSILNEFYNEFKKNTQNKYIFIVSKPFFEETENIKILRYPWVKKSWLHRILFDYFIAPHLINKYKADEVLSLQNIMIPFTNVKQTVYIHNSLPFADYRFSFKKNKLLWFYQNIISKCIFKSIKKANCIIVQSEWMKKRCLDIIDVDKNKIIVQRPKINIEVEKFFVPDDKNFTTFFYPANAEEFKNHNIIIEACKKLKEKRIFNYNIYFTLNGNENKNIAKLFSIVEKESLPIHFIGFITREKVFNFYSNSILLFPSFIETIGLPLLEAKMHNTPIIVSNNAFSREILSDYFFKVYFNNQDFIQLATILEQCINQKMKLFSN